MDIKNLLHSKAFTKALIALGVVAAAVVVFQAGVWVGYRKAAFSFRGGDNYYRSFGGPRGQFAPGLPHGEFPDAHGSAGRIIKIELPTFVIEDRDKTEKVILIKDDTAIRRFRDEIKTEDLKVDDFAVIIGAPNDQAQIEAKLIRIMPPPSEMPPEQMPSPRGDFRGWR